VRPDGIRAKLPAMAITIRNARDTDVEALAKLNAAAYPDLVQDGVVFGTTELRAHLAQFPEGQLVAVDGDRIVGAIATLVLPDSIDALGPHTWIGVTDHGTFARHDATGDTLYLADIYVHPDAWGLGVGRVLYAALFELCRSRRLARVVGGGRLHSFIEAPDDMTPEAYVAAVIAGERRDRVLQSQLRAGFQVRGLLPGYLHDWRSRHWATLIVWDNPERVQPPRGEARVNSRATC
jgi:GNAT superfamily N-acetyltransferase